MKLEEEILAEIRELSNQAMFHKVKAGAAEAKQQEVAADALMKLNLPLSSRLCMACGAVGDCGCN